MHSEQFEPATEVLGIPPFSHRTPIHELLSDVSQVEQWKSHFSWCVYVRIAEIHSRHAHVCPTSDLRLLDGFAESSASVAAALRITKGAADRMLNESLALTYRIPLIGKCLRDGIISTAHFQYLVTLTDLIDGMDYAAKVDESISRELRRKGVWSKPRLRDLADQHIFRHDPDAVRRRASKAKKSRSCGFIPLRDGMAQIGITATAEDTALAMAAVKALADSVCPHDPRTVAARRSDAAVSRLQGVSFECQCDREDCTATTADHGLSKSHARIVVHVICESPTLKGGSGDGSGGSGPADPTTSGPNPDAPTSDAPTPDAPGHHQADRTPVDNVTCEAQPAGPDPEPAVANASATAEKPGFIDGYGVISADQVRDIAARADAIIRPLNPQPGQPLPTHLPSDPYRFSAALDTFIRIRDAYCSFPGCSAPAWTCDIDHVSEFDHEHPEAGGQTCAENGKPKCKFHHLLKTFGRWLDDCYTDKRGVQHIEFRTPDGFVVHGEGHTNEDLFPLLGEITFQDPPKPQSADCSGGGAGENARTCDPARAGPQRRRTRTADKLARRRHERKQNRLAREATAGA